MSSFAGDAARREEIVTAARPDHVRRRRLHTALLAVFLGILSVSPFLLGEGPRTFIPLDDPQYVLDNATVRRGLTLDGLRWALVSLDCSNWHPLTWLSHMLDVSLFGLHASAHHSTSAALHALNTALLFWLLVRLTGRPWLAGCAAAFFGVHPLRVEPVAWISERKEVLAALFFLLALHAWERYARRAAKGRYIAALVLFAVGLTAKPMLVTLPLVLLLLDYWPLGRLGQRGGGGLPHALPSTGRLLLEKAPFLGLAAASSVITMIAQRPAISATDYIPVSTRIINAVVSSVAYLVKALWPSRLALYYPYPPDIPLGTVAVSAGALIVLSSLCLLGARRRPFLAAGWLWYLIMLVPVIGLIQVGGQAMADRYTYLPGIGLAIMLAWGVADRARMLRVRPILLRAAAAGVVSLLAAVSVRQAGFWEDAETILRRSLEVTGPNWMIRNKLGALLVLQGKPEEAFTHLREALLLTPRDASAYHNLGLALSQLERWEESAAAHRTALRLDPAHTEARRSLGLLLMRGGRPDEAISQYEEILRGGDKTAETYNDLGLALAEKGDFTGAVKAYEEAVRLSPGFVAALHNLGIALSQLERADDAIAMYRRALGHGADLPETHQNLGVLLARQGRTAEAAASFLEALRLHPDYAEARFNLGLLHLQEGEFDEAAAAFQEILRLQPDNAEASERLALALRKERGPAAGPEHGGR